MKKNELNIKALLGKSEIWMLSSSLPIVGGEGESAWYI